MSNSKIIPEKITNPIQLMAAWFVMLIILVGILLGAAHEISEPKWAAGYLIISSSVLITVVLYCVFLMLTKYRPHLQDSENYAIWIKDQNKYVNSKTPKETSAIIIPEIVPAIGRDPAEQIEFLKKAMRCPVEVADAPCSENIISELNSEGFRASLYKETFPIKEDKIDKSIAIWVGSELEPEAVLRAIEISLETWPHLQYMHLSTDSSGPEETHSQLFLGGSESAVKRLGLLPWTRDEILAIPKNITLNDFHQLIRDKYS